RRSRRRRRNRPPRSLRRHPSRGPAVPMGRKLPSRPDPSRPDPGAQRSPRHKGVPRPRVLLIIVVFGTFVCLLGLNGLMTSDIGVDGRGARSDGADAGVPAVISEGGPVIDLTRGRLDSHVLPPRTVALSFDDGPDPAWTPGILAV